MRALLVLGVTVAAVLLIRRARPVARGMLCFSIGLIATAAGGGIALPRLAGDGSASSAAALVETRRGRRGAGDRARVDAAGRRLAGERHSRGLRKVPVILALVCGTYAGLWSGVQAVVATNAPQGRLQAPRPRQTAACRTPTSPSLPTDGVTLSGWYLPSTNGSAVVLAHGIRGRRARRYSTRPPCWLAADTAIPLYDARGHGRSSGRAMDFGWYGDADVQGAVTFLGARPDVHSGRIAAVGLSMGGEEAIGAAATDPRIKAVVAEGATGRVAADTGLAVGALRRPGLGSKNASTSSPTPPPTSSPTRPPPRQPARGRGRRRPATGPAHRRRPEARRDRSGPLHPDGLTHHGPALAGPGKRPHKGASAPRRRSGNSGSWPSSKRPSRRPPHSRPAVEQRAHPDHRQPPSTRERQRARRGGCAHRAVGS